MRELPRTTALVASAVLLCELATGCSGSTGDEATPAPRPTSVAQLDTASMDLVRVDFCDLVPTSAVDAALGGPAESSEDWGNGEAPPLTTPLFKGGEHELTHEFGCSWTGSDQSTARAWVFARPVTAEFARQVIADGNGRDGCTTRPAGFGDPGSLQTCTTADNGSRIRYAGLFGATWLTCEIAGTGSIQPRVEPWCASVAEALDPKADAER